jgi:hypothetical protein
MYVTKDSGYLNILFGFGAKLLAGMADLTDGISFCVKTVQVARE